MLNRISSSNQDLITNKVVKHNLNEVLKNRAYLKFILESICRGNFSNSLLRNKDQGSKIRKSVSFEYFFNNFMTFVA
jgi:hypothetical protein